MGINETARSVNETNQILGKKFKLENNLLLLCPIYVLSLLFKLCIIINSWYGLV